jgi:FtsX-like permease family
MAVAWYRFTATFGRRWGGYLAIVLLIGMIGGIAMASVAAARRTQSSYPAFLASTNPSDLTMTVYSNGSGSAGASLTAEIARLADVRHVDSLVVPFFLPLTPHGAPRLDAANVVVSVGSMDGLMLGQDRLAVIEGRRADPNRADEIMMTSGAAKLLNVHVGQLVPLGLYTDAQMSQPGFGTTRVAPRLLVRARLVGIVTLNNEVLQDDVDQAFGFTFLTPALVREAAAVSADPITPTLYGLKLDHGARGVDQVERELVRLVPPGFTYQFHATSSIVGQMELSLKPESVALGVFGIIAALVCLVLGLQATSRQLGSADADRAVLRALGAGPAVTAADGLIGVLAAVVLGSLLAGAVAIGLSPLGPIGPVRPVYPDPGIAVDWRVLGTGFAILVIGLGTAAAAVSYRRASHLAARGERGTTRHSRVSRGAETAALPVAGVVGVRFALEPGQGRTAVPVRSVLSAAVLAVVVVVATLTFATSLNTLVSHPPLYGWNWSYALYPTNAVPPQALHLLSHDPLVAGWAGLDYTDAQIDGRAVPIILGRPGAKVAPPILSGHNLDGKDQIVLGAATLSLLHKHVGDTVSLSYETAKDAPEYIPPTKLVIVGTATFPAVGYDSFVAEHTSMGTGALVSTGIQPPAMRRAIQSPDPNLNGPELVVVRLRSGVSATAGRADMQRIARAANKALAADPRGVGNGVSVLGTLRPAQIVNYRTVGSTPVILAVGLAAGAIVALGLTLAASVRRRRRDLALLKTLGFTHRQLAAAVAWQATVIAAIGIILGIPLGIVLGRQLWILFARNINAVPDPAVPVLSVLLVAIGALVFANLDAALPGLDAARTPAALALRAE